MVVEACYWVMAGKEVGLVVVVVLEPVVVVVAILEMGCSGAVEPSSTL